MISFRAFLAEKKNKKESHYVGDDGVVVLTHVVGDKTEHKRPKNKVHKEKSKKKKVSESVELPDSHYTDVDENESILPWRKGETGLDENFNEVSEMSELLEKQMGNISKEHRRELSKYTKNSQEYNEELIDAHREGREFTDHNSFNDTQKKMLKRQHEALMSNTHTAGRNIHLFSGVNKDMVNAIDDAKKNNGILHSPAHISASHDVNVAAHFARQASFMNTEIYNPEKHGASHMIKVHVKPHQKIIHMSHVSDYPAEHESLIPAGTKLKYSHSTDHWTRRRPDHSDPDKAREKAKMTVHHFTIHDPWIKTN